MRQYSVAIKCKDRKRLDLITLRIAYWYEERDTEEILAALENGEISLNGDNSTSITIKNGESSVIFNDTSYMELPNVYDDPDDSEMFELFKSAALIAEASGAFEAEFKFCDDWAGYDHWGKCTFNGNKINYSDSVDVPNAKGINHDYSAELSGSSFINEDKDAHYKISGEPVPGYSSFANGDEADKKRIEAWIKKHEKDLNPEAPIIIKDKNYVFTGVKQYYQWPAILEKFTEMGGIQKSAVSGKTDYLVCEQLYAGETRIDKVKEFRAKGKDIKIILFDDFIDAIGIDIEALEDENDWDDEEEFYF